MMRKLLNWISERYTDNPEGLGYDLFFIVFGLTSAVLLLKMVLGC